MKRKLRIMILLVCVMVLYSCAGQNRSVSYPVPDNNNGDDEEPEQTIKINEITETQDGPGAAYLPDWLLAFINGGIAGVENLHLYRNSYLFIGRNRGSNFIALRKWAESFTVIQDFPRLAAVRIEKRLISAATLYPDDEYGIFFEALVKKAFGAEYPGAVKEEVYWIKTMINQEDNAAEPDTRREAYEFFVVASIDKTAMQTIIRDMMAEVIAAASPTRAQNTAINRLQQTFFEGF